MNAAWRQRSELGGGAGGIACFEQGGGHCERTQGFRRRVRQGKVGNESGDVFTEIETDQRGLQPQFGGGGFRGAGGKGGECLLPAASNWPALSCCSAI